MMACVIEKVTSVVSRHARRMTNRAENSTLFLVAMSVLQISVVSKCANM